MCGPGRAGHDFRRAALLTLSRPRSFTGVIQSRLFVADEASFVEHAVNAERPQTGAHPGSYQPSLGRGSSPEQVLTSSPSS
jgi:hypothetical protein